MDFGTLAANSPIPNLPIPISNIPMSNTIEVAIEPSLTSNAPNTVQSTIHTSSSTHSSIDVNGFDIYQMRRTNLIRVYDVSFLCRHRIHARDVILKVDNVPIENWSYTTLNDYLSNNVITSIETQSYQDYNLNLQDQVDSTLMTPNSASNTYNTTSANDTNQTLSTTSGNFF